MSYKDIKRPMKSLLTIILSFILSFLGQNDCLHAYMLVLKLLFTGRRREGKLGDLFLRLEWLERQGPWLECEKHENIMVVAMKLSYKRTHTNIHFLSPHKVQDQELNYLWWRLRLCQFSPAMCPRVWYHNCWVVLSCSRYSGVLHTYYSYSFSPAWKLISLMLSSTHAYCRMHPAPNLPTYTCDRNVTTWVWLISCVVPTRPLHVTFHCSRVWMGVAGVCDPQPTAETISVLLTIKIPRVRPNIKSH